MNTKTVIRIVHTILAAAAVGVLVGAEFRGISLSESLSAMLGLIIGLAFKRPVDMIRPEP